MQQDHESYHKSEKKVSWWKTPYGIVAIFFFIVAGYFLIGEHAVHIGSGWVWLILLLCPLMHFFMHRGHGHHHEDKENSDRGT